MGRFIVVVLDSVGIGELPDSGQYGDVGSNTLKNLAEAVGGFDLPNLEALGLGKIEAIRGLRPDVRALGAFGKMAQQAPGKDSISGHWELMGCIARQAQPTYPQGFPERIVERLRRSTGLDFLGNVAASGTEIIDRLGAKHLRTGWPILYTSADSVMQFAAHEELFPLPRLYELCRRAREMLSGADAVGRIIARPFIGLPGSFKRTANRKDFALEAPDDTVLDMLRRAGIDVLGIGKIEDLFAGRGLSQAVHTKSNTDGLREILKAILSDATGLIFTNLVDFDMLWGHRNDAQGYYRGLREVDAFLPQLVSALQSNDVLAFTADHGCDPTTPSTDHSREHVPILVYGHGIQPDINLGVRKTFADLGATVAEYFGIRGTGAGESFWSQTKTVGN